MPKIVFLGSTRFAPYEVLAVPDPIPGAGNDDEGYELACRKFYPAIEEADLVVAFIPDYMGEHTWRDMDYASRKGKRIVVITEGKVWDVKGKEE